MDFRASLATAGLLFFATWAYSQEALRPSVSTRQIEHSFAYTNHLIHSRDPYLLLHAHNPVDWYPWGPEALAKARKEGKPIFLSIGYSTCYWCHVAERTIYSNPQMARLMNQWFVNVKVDREQRPDVDQLYMSARQILTGNGGWPNNLFLTPDLKPFYAGSYFPPSDDSGQGPGFPTVLKSVHAYWIKERPKLNEVAQEVFTDLQEANQQATVTTNVRMDPKNWLRSACDTLSRQLDQRYGGIADFGGTKFPRSPELGLLLTDYQINGNEASLVAVRTTLDAIAYGGIHDHLGGGFHRYSTERTWSVPHFEKMLSDNAQLLRLYTRVFQLTADPLYRDQALAIGAYLARDMKAASGGFYSAQDAETNGVEGASYLWSRRQIEKVLGAEETSRFLGIYELSSVSDAKAPIAAEVKQGAVDQPGVLRIRLPIETALEQEGALDAAELVGVFAADRAKLLAARMRRGQPLRDDKVLTGINGLAISALVESAEALNQPQFLGWARTAAIEIWALAYHASTHSLEHEIFQQHGQTAGYLQDYALLGSGYLSLARATGEGTWRARAIVLTDDMLRRFAHADGSLSSTADEANLLVPVVDDGDSDTPSGTSAAIDLLQQVAVATGESRYADAAYRAARPLAKRIQQQPAAWATALIALNALAPVDADAAEAPAEKAGLAGSAEHVRVSAALSSARDSSQIEVTIQVDDGFHINANPPSFDYLIPTTLTFDQFTASNIAYPKALHFQPAFAPDGLDVYEGRVNLTASLPATVAQGLDSVSGTVRTQACDSQSCLAPSDLRFSVSLTSGKN